MFWLLISVQLVEFMWVIFNFAGLEQTSTGVKVSYLGDIHLHSMKFSHSVLSSVILAVFTYAVIRYIFKVKSLALPFSLGVLSHIILDLLTHAQDIPLTFFPGSVKLGTQLYSLHPYAAFSVELLYGLFCWYYFKGSRSLLAVILVFNIANFTTFSPDVIGLEKYFAGNPLLLVSVIASQIVVTLALVGYYSKQNKVETGEKENLKETDQIGIGEFPIRTSEQKY
jgi:membrane-bound metal-dependent hydrolase YbcI (DUF457 family)